jgi:hypothetical protein
MVATGSLSFKGKGEGKEKSDQFHLTLDPFTFSPSRFRLLLLVFDRLSSKPT